MGWFMNLFNTMFNQSSTYGYTSLVGIQNTTLSFQDKDGKDVTVSTDQLQQYFRIVSELTPMYYTDIAEVILNILESMIKTTIITDKELINIKDDEAKTKYINKVLSTIKFKERFSEDLRKFIFYGSLAYYIQKVDTNLSGKIEYKLFDLYNPYTTLTVYEDGSLDSYVIMNRSNQLTVVDADEMFCITNNQITIETTSAFDYVSDSYKCNDLSTIIKNFKFSVGKPLFYSIFDLIKEYYLKKMIIAQVELKDLVQPIILAMAFTRNTSPADAEDITRSVENMININNDSSLLITSQINIQNILFAIMNNIRVVPDYDSKITSIQPVQVDSLLQRMESIRNSLPELRNSIYSATGIPDSLVSGNMSKWDALKNSELLDSTIDSYVKMYILSMKSNCKRILDNSNKFDSTNVDDIQVIINNDSMYELNKKIKSMDVINEMLNSMSTLTSTYSNNIESEYVNPDEFQKIFNELSLKIFDRQFFKSMEEIKANKDSSNEN